MVLATVVSFVHPQITANIIPTNYMLMLIAIAIGYFCVVGVFFT